MTPEFVLFVASVLAAAAPVSAQAAPAWIYVSVQVYTYTRDANTHYLVDPRGMFRPVFKNHRIGILVSGKSLRVVGVAPCLIASRTNTLRMPHPSMVVSATTTPPTRQIAQPV